MCVGVGPTREREKRDVRIWKHRKFTRDSRSTFKGQESRERYIKVGPLDVSKPKAGKYVGFYSYLVFYIWRLYRSG